MSGVRTVTVGDGEQGIRLDRWFREHFPGLGHGQLQKLLRTGQVRVDGSRAKAGLRLAAGQEVRVPPLPDEAATEKRPAPARPKVDRRDIDEIRTRVLSMDRHVLAIDKPSGLAVQGGTGQGMHLDALLDGLRFDAAERPRLVHRLDKDTSGVLLLARTATAARFLTKAFRDKATRKIYWAVVVGRPSPEEGEIDAPLAKLPGRHGERVVVDDQGKGARTRYRTIDTAGRRAAWLELEPVTGRTHQLRAHCALIGHPILGDGKYGGRDASIDGLEHAPRLHLHARQIEVPHPAGGRFSCVAPLPDHIKETFSRLGFHLSDAD